MNFDEFYSCENTYFSREHSGGMEECLNKYAVQECKAVDIGAGEGRNAVWLAQKGFYVYAIEPSAVGVKKIEQKAVMAGIKLHVLNTDFLSATDGMSDIGFVLTMTSLEHMEYDYLIRTVKEVKRILKPGGYIYAMVFTEDDPGYRKEMEDTSECALFIKHYFKKGELRDLFSDFEILEYSEYIKIDDTHGPIHKHGKAKLFARKPI